MSHLFVYRDQEMTLLHMLDHTPNAEKFAMHTHVNTELFYFVKGKGTYHIEGSEYPLESGDLLILQPSESHYIEIDDSCPYERMVLNFNNTLFQAVDPEALLLKAVLARKPGKLNHYKGYEFAGGSCAGYWEQMTSPYGSRRINILAGLMPLLNEIYHIYTARADDTESGSDTTEYRIIHYINKNLSKPITLDDICQKYYISKSQLCRLFKKATGTTVWQYITIKRLIMAQQFLASGSAPTRIYSQCGFNDYSTFYRAYVRHFGHAPGEETDEQGHVAK